MFLFLQLSDMSHTKHDGLCQVKMLFVRYVIQWTLVSPHLQQFFQQLKETYEHDT